ncbi:phosphatidate cytidylyltransferase [Paludibacterium paludis]|uniref:Phosphatidate cytidylyltransferase n=1 Tax=Paludibacterium paludis TaxID=1225769 RepID=A0A918P5E6_9NEIS|nr:phosphatidate cytidylyltransferase [Paludibacterium paludis]GGY25597.1 phosphatidate cytidylyltransferase [Paludibacterium paludis]
MLKTRIITALCLLPLMLAALFVFPPELWAAFSWLVTGLALWEYCRMVGMRQPFMALYLSVSTLVAAALWLLKLRMPVAGHVAVLVFWLGVVPLWLKRRWTLKDGWTARALGWLLMFPAWFAFVEWRPAADPAMALALLAVMGLVWVADVAAYFAGRAFGRRKLAPAISPGKSWEGVWGGLLAVALYALAVTRLGWIALPVPLFAVIGVALVLAAVSVTGDLLESWFKRSAGMKDSSGLLPGHGGVYDRIDSLIAVLAVSHALKTLGGL